MKLIVFVVLLTVVLAEGANNNALNRYGLKNQQRKNSKATVTDLLTQLKQGIDLCNSRYEKSQQNTAFVFNDLSIFDIRIDAFPRKCLPYTRPTSCAAATACTQRSGIYNILLHIYSPEPFLVECDAKTEGGGWILVQRRQDGSENFNRNWSDYETGFGSVDGEFFIGLNKLYALTNYNGPQELVVLLKDKNGTRKAFYSNFVVGEENESYALKRLGAFSGDAGNALSPHLGAKFSTKGRSDDVCDGDCGQSYTGGWWHKECDNSSNLNGNYGDTNSAKGMTWTTFPAQRGSLQQVTMMIRRRLL